MDDQVRNPLTFRNPLPNRDKTIWATPEEAKWHIDVYARAFPNDRYTVIYDKQRTEVEPWGGERLVNELEDHIGKMMGMEKSEDVAFAARCCRYLLGYLDGKGMPSIEDTPEYQAGHIAGVFVGETI